MVGVQRSTGCWTCRRRKVKCGEEKPFCERCKKAGFQCGGYTTRLQFVDQNSLASRPRRRKSPTKSPPTDPDQRSAPLVKKTLSPLSNDLYVSFAVQRLYGHKIESPGLNYKAWVISITKDAQPSDVSSTAFSCLATAYFGRINRRADILAHGSYLYGKALLQLKSAINTPATAFDARNVAATMAVCQYETLVYTSTYGWVQHAGGTGRLMEMRGPHAHQDGLSHKCFLLSRYGIINQAVVSRQRTFLERPEWLHIPWANDLNSKTTTDHLMDIFAHVPGIYEEYDRLSVLAGLSMEDRTPDSTLR